MSDLRPHSVNVRVEGPYVRPDRPMPDAWYYREYKDNGEDTGAVDVHFEVIVGDEMYHFTLDVPRRTTKERRYLTAALAAEKKP